MASRACLRACSSACVCACECSVAACSDFCWRLCVHLAVSAPVLDWGCECYTNLCLLVAHDGVAITRLPRRTGRHVREPTMRVWQDLGIAMTMRVCREGPCAMRREPPARKPCVSAVRRTVCAYCGGGGIFQSYASAVRRTVCAYCGGLLSFRHLPVIRACREEPCMSAVRRTVRL